MWIVEEMATWESSLPHAQGQGQAEVSSVPFSSSDEYDSIFFDTTTTTSTTFTFNEDLDHEDWNGRYQKIVELPSETPSERLLKVTLICGLNRDFISTATVCAKTIISEYFLPPNMKSIQPKEIGGIAGGQKYLWRGIVFKLADGSKGPYANSDEAAAKAMGQELKGANAYAQCRIPSLHVGLQALIDYKGFRMHAQALLPINSSTIVVGSSDAGKTVHCESDELMQILEKASIEMNLREHIVSGVKLYSACDIEGHLGTDNRYYIIDLARTFPPESPECTCFDYDVQTKKFVIFWRYLRPEFVKYRGSLLFGGRSSIIQNSPLIRKQSTESLLPNNTCEDGVDDLPPDPSPYLYHSYSFPLAKCEVGSNYNALPNNSLIYDSSDEILGSRNYNSADIMAHQSSIDNHNVMYDNAKPLSPDALSNFCRSDPNYRELNDDVHTATYFLVRTLIPYLANDLMKNGHPTNREALKLSEYLHKHGVNVRYLGLLRSYLQDEDLRTQILLEIVFRSLKNILKEQQRKWMKRFKNTSEDGMITLIVNFFNLFTGSNPRSNIFWESVVIPAIGQRFGSFWLCEEEQINLQSIILSITHIDKIFFNFCKRVGIRLSSECEKQFQFSAASNSLLGFEFASPDILEIFPVVKHMHQVDVSTGMMLCLQAQIKEMEKRKNTASGTIVRLLSLAVDKLHQARNAVPNDITTIHLLAEAYQTKGFAITESSPELAKAEFAKFQSLLQNDSFMKCCVTGMTFHEGILGLCIMFEYFNKRGPKPRRQSNEGSGESVPVRIKNVAVSLRCISYEYYLNESQEALRSVFEKVSVEKLQQQHYVRFFPVIFNGDHYKRCSSLLHKEIVLADILTNEEYRNYLGNPTEFPLPKLSPESGLRVISSIMNSMVLEFVNHYERHDIYPSESSLLCYCRFHHMLLNLAKQDQTWSRLADSMIESFINSRENRNKTNYPDVGRLLVYALLCKQGWSTAFRYAYLSEVLIRQPLWFYDKCPELYVLEKDIVSPWRLYTTFQATLKSLRLVMFQIYFIRSVVGKNASNRHEDSVDPLLDLYNSSLGRPTAAMMNNHHREFAEILKVSNYAQFLARLGCEYSPAQLTVSLRNAIRIGLQDSYFQGGYKHIVSSDENFKKNEEFIPVYSENDTSWEATVNSFDDYNMEEISIEKKSEWKRAWSKFSQKEVKQSPSKDYSWS